MRKEIHIDISPLTSTIYAGFVSKDGTHWTEANRTVVTGKACAAVAQHVLAKGGVIEVYENGSPKWEIQCTEIAASEVKS